MNGKLIVKIMGLILVIEAAFMVLPLIVSICYKDGDWKYFLLTLLGCLVIGIPILLLKTNNKNLYAKDGFVIVALSWVLLSLVGAVPFTISGTIPNYLDAVFEAVSGFTTSGVTIMPDVEIATMSMLFWRSLTHWIGGMGVLVFMLALTPVAGGASMHILRAESPGPTTEKVLPKISQTAKYLYIAYLALTLIQTVLLLFTGLPLTNSFIIAFGTMATGGFTYLNTGLATFTGIQLIIITVFMILAGMNFSLFFLMVTGKIKKAFKDIELRWYLITMAVVFVLISLNVLIQLGQIETFGNTIIHTLFATASAMTSTGFSAYDYGLWPWFTKGLLVLVMFIGGCAGSTAGGIKVSRFVVLFKAVKRNIREKMHPRSVNSFMYNDKEISSDVVAGILVYFGIFIIIFVTSMVIVSLEPGMDLSTALTSVSTTLNNNGIEFKSPGIGGFYTYAWWTKLVYIIDMLFGRLEIFPIVVFIGTIFSPISNFGKKIKNRIG